MVEDVPGMYRGVTSKEPPGGIGIVKKTSVRLVPLAQSLWGAGLWRQI